MRLHPAEAFFFVALTIIVLVALGFTAANDDVLPTVILAIAAVALAVAFCLRWFGLAAPERTGRRWR
jgi:hypothetical membrane protein